ncbi:GntR family transcriptional regulator [Phyllobacterium sp. SB3]|uniref:GntR family transcriptional regulator n=1 Tax=Phyllobacterium sp. SB3 TaxID=3156073 RepID=UPI0032AF56EA
MTASQLTLHIANELAALIQADEIAANSHLSTQKLADRFQVSRSPIREALETLEKRGILERRANRGFFVREVPTIGRQHLDVPQPPDASSLYYQLAECWIRDEIPGEVTEQWLRDRYGLTKVQVNDILNRATEEGWAERKQGYGWRFLYVVKTPEALEQLYRFRSVIEPAGFLEPTFYLQSDLMRTQKRVQESMLAGDIERWPAERLLRVGTDFHEALALCSGNAIFHQALVRANRMRRLLEYRSMLDRSRLYLQCQEHLQILDLLERGENIEAASLMRRHLSGALAKKSPVYQQLLGAAPGEKALTATSAEE